MKKTAWFDKYNLPDKMLNSEFKPLEHSEHYKSLKTCFNLAKGNKLLDIGCGRGDISQVFLDYEYTGADLPHIVEKVSKIKNPNSKFLHFDAESDSYEFIKDYDIILMNSFLSEIPFWYKCINKILLNSEKYIIIHRQEITKDESRLEEYKTYANLRTIKTIINDKEFKKIINLNNFEIMYETNSFFNNEGQKTFLLRKNNVN